MIVQKFHCIRIENIVFPLKFIIRREKKSFFFFVVEGEKPLSHYSSKWGGGHHVTYPAPSGNVTQADPLNLIPKVGLLGPVGNVKNELVSYPV